MAISEEEQMAAMLQEMGLDSMDQLEEEQLAPQPSVDLDMVTDSIETKQSEDTSFTDKFNPKIKTLNPPKKENENNSRELTVNSLMHLMGLPNNKQFNLLDGKLDLVVSKISSLQAKIDKLGQQLEKVSSNSSTERIEFQLTEIRSIMKKFFPTAFKLESNSIKEPNTTKTKPDPTRSQNTQAETKIVEAQAIRPEEEEEEEEDLPMTDEEYQNSESSKLRKQMEEKYNSKG